MADFQSSDNPLFTAERFHDEIVKFTGRYGIAKAAVMLGVARETLLRLLVKLPTQQGSRLVVERQLSKLLKHEAASQKGEVA